VLGRPDGLNPGPSFATPRCLPEWKVRLGVEPLLATLPDMGRLFHSMHEDSNNNFFYDKQ